mmetsp:Transcript_5796/g.12201  ORF Transcript_5796/g.12201 Transcript_5796/m.12201 type:complete len:248 (-) Transcript_5796:397-1140(-)|eukprot:CAMPEP_0174721674 /NCGR_PEP_ID=MMETSP1094-20130205/36861_1 /TAXON_ID=156173 /ORGANISM="Chrysochromulina brevifilum, Strain UTEX LB 985" /LENGTH=247 /DNA_ID=CAMNT_0015922413 /DNA_START=53 /DNA_END=799 /DNA_ORIENTATION=-
MDLSLDEIIKAQRQENLTTKPSGAIGKAPGKPKAKQQKGKPNKPASGGAGASLTAAVNQSSKAKRAAKLAAARGMEIDTAPAPVVLKGAKSKVKIMVGKGAKMKVGNGANTLKERMSQAMTKVIGGNPQAAASPTKASNVKITIPGAAAAGKGNGAVGKGKGTVGSGKGKGRGGGAVGGGRGGIIMPGANKTKSTAGLTGAIKKARTIVLQGGAKVVGRAPGQVKAGRGAGKGKGRGGGRNRGRGGR